MKKIFFAVVRDDGNNYEALRIKSTDKGLKVESGYLPGYKYDAKDDPKAYEYKKGGLEYSSAINEDPSILFRILETFEDQAGVKALFKTTAENCVKQVQEFKSQMPSEANLDNTYLSAKVLHSLANMPQFLHKRVPEAFQIAEDIYDDPFVQLPGLVFIDGVLRSLPAGATLEVKEIADGDLMLHGVTTIKKYGQETKKEVSEFAFCAEPIEFDSTLCKTRELMEAGIYPAHPWILENVQQSPEI